MRPVLIPVLVLLALTAQPALADDDKKHEPAPRGHVTKTEAQRPAPPRKPEAVAPAVQPQPRPVEKPRPQPAAPPPPPPPTAAPPPQAPPARPAAEQVEPQRLPPAAMDVAPAPAPPQVEGSAPAPPPPRPLPVAPQPQTPPLSPPQRVLEPTLEPEVIDISNDRNARSQRTPVAPAPTATRVPTAQPSPTTPPRAADLVDGVVAQSFEPVLAGGRLGLAGAAVTGLAVLALRAVRRRR